MPLYVDGFVFPIPKRNLPAYRRMARLGSRVWHDHGALEYRECIGDEIKLKWSASFQQRLRMKPGDTVVFSWIVYRSKAHRNRVNAAVMKDPRLKAMMDPKKMPFDMKRMLSGGFRMIVSA